MNCMKCGREVESEHVFCDDCLLDMEKYPVKPGTAVQLPLRQSTSPVRKSQPRRRKLSLEEQVRNLKKQIRFLIIALAVTFALVLALIYPAANYFIKNYHLRPGQNYTAIVSPTVPTDTVAETTG